MIFNLVFVMELAGKMVLLDKLLPKLKERDSRVLIFSQVCILFLWQSMIIVWIATVTH